MNVSLGPESQNATADSRGQCDDSRVPWSLQSVACLFLILGVLDVTEWVLQFTVFGCVYLSPFGPIFILMGRGLLLRRETWRYWAVLICWFVVAIVCIGFVALLWLVVSGSTMVEELITSMPGALRKIMAGILAVGLFYVWPLYVLRRPTIVRLFRTATSKAGTGPTSRAARGFFGRWTFSLRALLLLMAIAAFVSWRLSATDVLYRVDHYSRVSSGSQTINQIEFAVRTNRISNDFGQLHYAVFAFDNSRLQGRVTVGSGRESQDAWLELPNGIRLALPGPQQLYEIQDGKGYTCDERITLSELEDYLAAKPTKYDLESLLNHVWALRGNQGKPPEKRAVEY